MLCFSIETASADRSAVGRVMKLHGEVVAQHGNEARVLSVGSAVYRRDALLTNDEAKVLISFDDGSVMTVGPKTRVELETFAPDDGGVVDLIFGVIRLLIAESERTDSVSIRARTATASVRSTGLIVSTDPTTTGVFVLDGVVVVSAPGHEKLVHLSAGQGSDIPQGEPPGRAKQWPAERVETLQAQTRID